MLLTLCILLTSCIFPVKFDLYDKEDGGKSITPQWMKPEDFTSKQRLSANQKAKALKRASGFKSKDPFFMVAMQPSFVGANPVMVSFFTSSV